MSIIYCDMCDQQVDTDEDAEGARDIDAGVYSCGRCQEKYLKAEIAPQNRGSNLNKGCDCKGATDLSEHQPWCASLPNNQS